MWYACSISLNSHFEGLSVDTPVALGSGIRIERIPEWVKADEALKLLSWKDRENIKDAELAFASEYESDALGSPDPDWNGASPRSIQASIDEKFSLLSVTLWLSKPSTLTCGPTLHFGKMGEPDSLRTAGVLRPVLINEAENNNVPSLDDLKKAGDLLASVLGIQRSGSVWVAIRMLIRALTENMWEARYFWDWVVLEAIFGPENPNETTYRLSQRIGLFLGRDAESRKRIFDNAKNAYIWRSKIAHGGRLGKLTPERSQEMTEITEGMIREAMVKILSNQELLLKFNSKNRDEYLDSLLFTDRA